MARQKIAQSRRFAILREHGFKCFYCGTSAQESKLHIDHVIPVSLGGTNDPWNLVPACASCNLGKFDSAPTSEMVAMARDRWFHARRRRSWARCWVCGIPVPEVEGEDAFDCDQCSEKIQWAWCEGWRHGRRAA